MRIVMICIGGLSCLSSIVLSASEPTAQAAPVPTSVVTAVPQTQESMPATEPVVISAPTIIPSVANVVVPTPAPVPVAPVVVTVPTEAPAAVPAAEAQPAVPATPAPTVQIQTAEQPTPASDEPTQSPVAPAEPSEVPAAPEPPQQVAPQEPKPEEVAPEDFDTSKLKEYGGNWYFKQGWWQRAEREYEKARQVIDQIFEARMEFFERQSSLNRNLFDPFYMEIGFERNELQDVIDLLIDKLDKERKNEGMLDIKERELLSKIEEEKNALEQLKLNAELVNKYDIAISNVISELLKQLNQARQYEQIAWQEFKAIAEDLNDVIARSRFYAVKTQHKNIKNILEYLKGSFKEYFDKLESNAKNEIDLVKESIKKLKARGLDLKEQARLLVEEEKETKKPEIAEQAQEEPSQYGFFMRFIFAIGTFFKAIWNFLLGWLYRF